MVLGMNLKDSHVDVQTGSFMQLTIALSRQPPKPMQMAQTLLEHPDFHMEVPKRGGPQIHPKSITLILSSWESQEASLFFGSPHLTTKPEHPMAWQFTRYTPESRLLLGLVLETQNLCAEIFLTHALVKSEGMLVKKRGYGRKLVQREGWHYCHYGGDCCPQLRL